MPQLLGVTMYIRFKQSGSSKHKTIQIVKGVRNGSKVMQKVIASLGTVKDDEDLKRLKRLAENLIQKLEKEGLPPDNKININDLIHTNTIYDGFGLVVDRLMTLTNLKKIIQDAQGRNKFDLEEIIKLIILQRFDLPSSKLRTFERQEEHGFYGIELQHVYRAMDAIEGYYKDFQKQIFETLCKYSSCTMDCFFFDVTTLYFESVNQDSIRNFGFSKDQKQHQVQIVLALVVDREGIPIAYEVFEGNLAETKTLIPVLESLRTHFNIVNVTVVCDRGLASKANIEALQKSNFYFVIATKLRSISKKIKINDLSLYRLLPNQENIPEEEKVYFYTMNHPQYEETTLIATYSPSRARKDKEDRERLLEKLTNKLKTSDEASVKKIISNGGYKKFTNIKKGSMAMLNQDAIDEDISWDGFHGIAVSNNAKLNVSEALFRYHDLWHVEEAFRVTKSTMRTRPIFHWSPHRIRCHVLLCFITLFFERFLESLLRKNDTPLTPDRIRHALAGAHKIRFIEKTTNKIAEMNSSLSPDAEVIFKILNIPITRSTAMVVPKN